MAMLKSKPLHFKELNKLEIGDYVTHMDHGIGKFGGLQKIDVQGKKQEAIKLGLWRKRYFICQHSLTS